MNVVSLETIRIQKQEEWNEAREVAERYFQHLMSLGWGVYRIGEAHAIEPYYPAGKGMIRHAYVEAKGIWTQDYLIDRLTDYIIDGGELLDA
jgi:hypothetical protein